MATEDINKSGITMFSPPHSRNYRFNNNLKGWQDEQLDGRLLKQEAMVLLIVCTGDMLLEDFVTSENKIPTANVADYIKCFYNCLDCNLNSVCPVKRALTELTGDTIRLQLTLTISFLRSPKYTFNLDPVSLTQVDVLESKMRDQNDELVRLRDQLNAVHEASRAGVNLFIKLEAERISSSQGTYSRRLSHQWGHQCCAKQYQLHRDLEKRCVHPT
ncbi:unnamed protein product [Peronospora belbahrii]|uniref:Uncharacterized protein n=1 Tax=Peronospora belbahrii TaxID=622444 RepID=A0AAU9KU26_9STRA|nr:unnamed protein product [Peronospora belbahrii]